MPSLYRVICLSLFCISPVVAAQPPAPATPPLQEILLNLQNNLWDYLANVPSFFADEHVVSSLKQEGAREVKTTTDSIFRLERSKVIGESRNFTESREVKQVNKKPASGDQVRGPAIFTGGFSTAAGMVSLEMSRCFDYTVQQPGEPGKDSTVKTPAIIIDYAFKPDMLTDDGCPGPEKQSGRAWIDPVTFHPLRVECSVPSHLDNNGLRVLWTWSVDYAPVSIDGRQFWMPHAITSRSDANDASGTWLFTATYTNYHKLTVTSHIVTGDPSSPK